MRFRILLNGISIQKSLDYCAFQAMSLSYLPRSTLHSGKAKGPEGGRIRCRTSPPMADRPIRARPAKRSGLLAHRYAATRVLITRASGPISRIVCEEIIAKWGGGVVGRTHRTANP